MADHTGIEWTDATWNPLRGCTRVSEGCRHCYAEAVAARFSGPGQPYEGLARFVDRPGGAREPRWTGEVRLVEDHLLDPLRWKRPRRIFVNSMSDLFHESVPDEWIDRVFAVMALAPQHTFQILTKRPDRMLGFMSPPELPALGRLPLERIHLEASAIDGGPLDPLQRFGNLYSLYCSVPWPLPNVWLGVSVEDQETANNRIPTLLETPAAVRFTSAEPLLGPLNLRQIHLAPDYSWVIDALDGHAVASTADQPGRPARPMLDWVIAGGESGSRARPMHPAWVRSLRDQCAAAGIPFLFKQWGAWAPTTGIDTYSHGPHRHRRFPNAAGIAWLADGRVCLRDFTVAEHQARIRRGEARDTRAIDVDAVAIRDYVTSIEDPGRDRDNPRGLEWMYEIGKGAAGRLLDGVIHDAYPEPRS